MTPIHILLVEDNEGDIMLTMEALEEGKVRNKISIARDGEQAIQFLNKKGQYIHSERPDLVLLDINMPRVDGKQVLEYIKTNPLLKAIPVIMLTTSTSEKIYLNLIKITPIVIYQSRLTWTSFLTLFKKLKTSGFLLYTSLKMFNHVTRCRN